MKLAIVAAFKAFVDQAKRNRYEYCKRVVDKVEGKPQQKKESK